MRGAWGARVPAQLRLVADSLRLPKREIEDSDSFTITVTGRALRSMVAVLIRHTIRTDPLRETLRTVMRDDER